MNKIQHLRPPCSSSLLWPLKLGENSGNKTIDAHANSHRFACSKLRYEMFKKGEPFLLLLSCFGWWPIGGRNPSWRVFAEPRGGVGIAVVYPMFAAENVSVGKGKGIGEIDLTSVKSIHVNTANIFYQNVFRSSEWHPWRSRWLACIDASRIAREVFWRKPGSVL